jgi:hypothetical protein
MKRIKTILACGLTLTLTGLTTLLVAAGAGNSAIALVRSMHGSVEYKFGSEPFKPLRTNQELPPGTLLKSGPGAEAYLQVNGLTSTIKLTENTTVTLATMLSWPSGDSSTNLKLDGGEILGSIKKLPANSDYKITVPNGVASIRGTDVDVKVVLGANGAITVTFTSVTGVLLCQVNAPLGQTADQATKTLNTGESWTVTGNVNGTTLTLGVLTPLTPLQRAAFNSAFGVFPTPVPPPTPGGGVSAPVVPPVVPSSTNPSDTGGGSSSPG